jgi:hypothetical protein
VTCHDVRHYGKTNVTCETILVLMPKNKTRFITDNND